MPKKKTLEQRAKEYLWTTWRNPEVSIRLSDAWLAGYRESQKDERRKRKENRKL